MVRTKTFLFLFNGDFSCKGIEEKLTFEGLLIKTSLSQ